MSSPHRGRRTSGTPPSTPTASSTRRAMSSGSPTASSPGTTHGYIRCPACSGEMVVLVGSPSAIRPHLKEFPHVSRSPADLTYPEFSGNLTCPLCKYRMELTAKERAGSVTEMPFSDYPMDPYGDSSPEPRPPKRKRSATPPPDPYAGRTRRNDTLFHDYF